MEKLIKIISAIFIAAFIIIPTLGWIKCVVKFVKSDFDAPYKAEIVYGIGTFTGAGAVIGYINIRD